MEEVVVTQAINTNDNIGLSFTAGSLTTYQGRNPSFSVVEMDAEYMVPVTYKTYFLNISKINSEADDVSPKWEKLHDFMMEYNLTDLSPNSIQEGLANQILVNEQTAINYLWNKNKRAP